MRPDNDPEVAKSKGDVDAYEAGNTAGEADKNGDWEVNEGNYCDDDPRHQEPRFPINNI